MTFTRRVYNAMGRMVGHELTAAGLDRLKQEGTMNTRAKMILDSVIQHYWAPNVRTFKFQCQYDDSIPEDQRFHAATPSGTMEMLVTNTAVIDSFKLGQAYYLTLTEAPKS